MSFVEEPAPYEAEQYYLQMLEALPVAIYTTDATGRITYFNAAAAGMAGRHPRLGTLLEQRVERRTQALAETSDRLRESEQTFRLLVQSVTDYAIYMVDPEGHVANWNSGAERIKGYTRAESSGRIFPASIPTKIALVACPLVRSLLRPVKDISNRRHGASARTAAGSGLTS